MLLTALCAALSACGGGGGGDTGTDTGGAASPAPRLLGGTIVGTTAPIVLSAGTATFPASGAAPAPTGPVGFSSVTSVQWTSTSTQPQVNAPVTFGQVFAVGDVRSGESVAAKTASGLNVPLQVDVKARHPDGSLRHAVISALLPTSMPAQTQTLYLVKAGAATNNAAATPAALLNAGFTASFSATIDGQQYTASADTLLRGKYTTWLAGPVANEWLVSAPLKSAQGVEHPHLSARFAIRAVAGGNAARVDVTVENNWSHEPSPQNFTYDAQILVGGKPAYAKAAMTHFHHARWHKTFWWGQEPQFDIKHNTGYLIASKAVPNYNQTLVFKDSAISALKTTWLKDGNEPMTRGLALAYMPTTGGRREIGLLPSWAAIYLLNMDARAKEITLGMSEQAGSWSAHYRNKKTDRPVTLVDYPYMTILGRVEGTRNPVTKQLEAFPECPATVCKTPFIPDAAHQPSFAYLPYLVTGDYYHLEELQFWAMWNAFHTNPYYREYGNGLVYSGQVRAQAWSLRSLGEAAYITPDSDPLKAQFTSIVNNNIAWYTSNYSDNPLANKLGALVHGVAISKDNNTDTSPWQDDFFTSAVGRLVEIGFPKAAPLLAWKSKFSVDRMVGAGACWIDGAKYNMKMRASATAPFYTTIAEVYQASHTAEFLALPCAGQAMALSLKLTLNEMTGYSSSPTGFPSNMQPALAFSANVNAQGQLAWKQFMSRSVKPDYSIEPQFDIVPRN